MTEEDSPPSSDFESHDFPINITCYYFLFLVSYKPVGLKVEGEFIFCSINPKCNAASCQTLTLVMLRGATGEEMATFYVILFCSYMLE